MNDSEPFSHSLRSESWLLKSLLPPPSSSLPPLPPPLHLLLPPPPPPSPSPSSSSFLSLFLSQHVISTHDGSPSPSTMSGNRLKPSPEVDVSTMLLVQPAEPSIVSAVACVSHRVTTCGPAPPRHSARCHHHVNMTGLACWRMKDMCPDHPVT
ncbi:uncharacterized protein [Gorilla gorilla gorilla]|uniref:uncharacterized protein n=1 Tax=Gorilla gorilla gorilla TaxID=9595 RepID=UPI0024461A45|nr:uncharacterized protein LOC129532329 [Gorilla gorilla gorilla]